jgi:hypothetical protein
LAAFITAMRQNNLPFICDSCEISRHEYLFCAVGRIVAGAVIFGGKILLAVCADR